MQTKKTITAFANIKNKPTQNIIDYFDTILNEASF